MQLDKNDRWSYFYEKLHLCIIEDFDNCFQGYGTVNRYLFYINPLYLLNRLINDLYARFSFLSVKCHANSQYTMSSIRMIASTTSCSAQLLIPVVLAVIDS